MIMSQQGDYMSKKNLKDAHFLVPLENNTPSVVTSLMLISFSVLLLMPRFNDFCETSKPLYQF